MSASANSDEIQLLILKATEAIEQVRARVASGDLSERDGKADVEKLLGTIARLKAEKSRRALHHG